MKIFFINIMLLISPYLNAQVWLEWEARYNYGEAKVISLDKDNNIFIACFGIILIKYNPSGQLQWVQTYSGPQNLYSFPTSMAVDDSGNVYVSGTSFNGYVGGNSEYNYVTLKYSPTGEQKWVRVYSTAPGSFEVASSLCLDENANVYVTGYYGMRTIKYDRNGNQLWSVIYPVNAQNRANKIFYKNGYVYVTGYSYIPGNSPNYITIKYNSSNGSQMWAAIYNGTGNSTDEAYCLAVDDSNNVYVGGNSYGTNWNLTTIKYNSSGIQQWVNRFLGTNTSVISDMVMDNNSIYITGGGGGMGGGDYLTLKYNFSGIQQWVNYYNSGGFQNDFAFSIALDKFSNVYVTGYSQYPPPIFRNITTIKYNSEGKQQWLKNYNSIYSSTDIGHAIAVDPLLNVYVTGRSDSATTPQILLLKYSQTPLSIHQNEIPLQFKLNQNYPNPFNPATTINYELPAASNVILKVFDLLGREVSTLVEERQNAGNYSVEFNAERLSSGVYFLRMHAFGNGLKAGGFVEIRKMILLK